MATADASPGVMTSRPYTEQHVADKIKEWVAQETNGDIKTQFYKKAISYIESNVIGRQISCLETTWVERQYVKIVLEMWLRASFEKAFAYLGEKSSDFNTQISELLRQLKLINSFEDILDLPAESKLRDWCECRYLQLILGQTSLFKTTPRFAILVPSYFQHFKTSLSDQIISRSRKGLTEDQIDFISALNEFLADAINRDHTRSQDSLEENFLVINFEKVWLEKMVNSFKINNKNSEETKKTYGLRDRFKSMNASLSDDSWTPQLKFLIKETCETFLLPKTVIEVQNEDGKEIISIKGVAVFVSQILQEMIDLKIQNSNVKEIKIVGLLSVHVDCDLKSKDWHGMNVGIVTDKLYVDKEVHWDVSGQHGNDQPEVDPDGQPGESGGNIHVICQEMMDAEKWTIISDGGNGRDGQNGVDGRTVPHRKWLKEDFMKAFPTMSTLDDSSNEKAMETVLKTLEDILPVNIRNFGQHILPGHRDHFFLHNTTKDGSNLTVAYYHKAKLGITTQRHTYILSKGSKVGQGGYGGSITIEYLRSEDPEIPLGIPFVGRDGQQPSAVRMSCGEPDVYYEASGSVGRTGKPAGDVGFIHRVKRKDRNKKGEGHYFGFDNDVGLKLEERDDKEDFQKDNIPYAKFMDPYRFPKAISYASILSADHVNFPGELKHSPMTPTTAVKMKAIIRQNLVQHLTEIDERKQTAQSLKAATSDSTEQQSDYIDKLIGQIDQKQAQLYSLSRQRNQQREELRQCYVRPSVRTTKVPNSLNSFTIPVGQRGRRPVDLQRTPIITCFEKCLWDDLNYLCLAEGLQIDLSKITCLDLLPTVNGNDSALHSILGRMNSAGLFICADTDKIRQQLADFFQNKENEANQIKAVKNFVLRQNDDEVFPFASARKKELLTFRQQNGDESQFDWLQAELSEEYVRFIESPLGELDLPEVECLAKFLYITIHVYEDQYNSSSFKHKITFKPSNGSPLKQNHFILYKGCGEWQRLEYKCNFHQFCNQLPMDLLQQPVQQQTNSFSTLIDLLTKWNHHDLIASVEMLNPEDGVTPDKLSQYLLEKHFSKLRTATPSEDEQQNNEAIDKQLCKIAPDIRLLTERVLEYNERNVSPFFYLYIVSICTDPSDWKYEFLLLEMEERLTQLPENRNFWREKILTSLKNLDDQTVAQLRGSLMMATDFGDCPFSTMERILKMLPVKSGSNENDSGRVDQLPIELLSQLPLNDWLYELRSKIWERKVNQLTAGDDLRHGELEILMKEAVHLLLELEYQKGESFYDITHLLTNITDLPKLVDKLRETLYPYTNSTVSVKERDWKTIMSIIEKEGKRKCDMKDEMESQTILLECIKRNVIDSKSKQPEMGENLKKLTEKLHTKLRNLKNSELLSEYLHVYDSVVELVMGFPLRDTQRVAIMFLLEQKKLKGNILVQVSTGEGKSLIVAGVAILCALSGQKVDVVTSNDVLALRDSTLSKDDGGLRELYEYFNVGVANNCSQSQDDRAKAYNSTVVYGELANFQRDYLLQTFYGLNIRGDRKMDYVIIDEVDCMLLDRGSNTLYLSHDIPGMEMLESLYVFIWERIQRSVQLDVIKTEILYDLYGAIGKKDLEKIHAPLKDKSSEKNKLWHYLIQDRVIDPNGRCLIKNVEENKIDYKENTSLNSKLIFFFRKVIERERHIRIPKHLLSFVDRHLDTWLANALRALELKQDEDYVIDQDRTDTCPDLSPQVIIIDPDTGTDQTTSQWDGALHQFVQLKEGCKLTLQSLKAVFISNEVYIKKYERIAGVSGTLGSTKERKYMMNSYYCDYVSIPTAFPKRFIYKMPKVLKTKESWLLSIINEIRETIITENKEKARSIVIFCRTIKYVNIVHNHIKINFQQLLANNKLHRYIRDYEQFAFEAKQLEIGHVIIATNLAGRGTDIKISDKLLQNGGLHICLTYLPQNERILMQAMGRSGRNGAPGSGILILFQCHDRMKTKETQEHSTDTEWSVAKFFSMNGERDREELQRIARLQTDSKSTKNQLKYFDIFSDQYADLKNQMRDKENVVIRLMCDSALDQWALWLDEIDIERIVKTSDFHIRKYLEASLINRLQFSESPSNISWMLPGRSVALAKYLAKKESGINFSFNIPVKATTETTKNKEAEARKISASLLEKLVESNDAFFYPAAPYYLAFLTIKEGEGEKKQTDITKMLRSSETILNEHIRMQMSFYRKINQNFSQSQSFCAIDSYKQQKVNIANILGHYINSIRSLLGSHYCSASNLEQAGINRQRVDKLFERLKIDCIVQQPKLNDDETVPNQKAAIQHVANIHVVDDPASLEENLASAFKKVNLLMLNEKEIEEKILKEIEISFTRKTFWKNMMKERVVEDAMDFVIMDDSECDIDPKLDRDEKLTIDFASKDYVFFRAMPYAAEEMIQQKKIVFPKQYVKDIIKKSNHLEYHRRKKTFELNKMGRLNLIQLKEINEKKRNKAQLKEDDLRGIFIVREERKGISDELQIQKIIDRQGYLAPEYKGQEFRYPQCPAYEDAVMGLLGRKFTIEIVIQQWLNSKDDPELLKAIELLPLNPHRNMLADLMASHVIAGARVKDDLTDTNIIQAIEKISDDKEERKCLLNYLRSRQALYDPTESPDDFSLDFIEREIRTQKGMDNISAELLLYGLVGFDQHIIFKNDKNKWSFKTVSQALISILVGGGLMVGGYFLDKALGDVPSMFGINFLVTGGTASLFNGIEILLLRNKSTWTDYGRQSLMNVVGNPDPFSTIWKLFKSRNKTPSLPSSFNVQEPILTENQLVKVFATAGKILHDNYRLFGSHLVEKINKIVENSMAQMKETLIKVWQSHNHEDIKRLVKGKMENLITDWFEKGKVWVSEVKQIVLREATMEPNQLMPIVFKHLENFALKIKMVHVTVECLKQFRADLEEDFSKMQELSALTTDHFDVEMGERFYKKVVENMKSELARKAEQIMKLFQTEFDSSTTEQEDAEEK